MTAFLMRRPVIALRRQSHTAYPCDEDVEIRSSKPLVPPIVVAGAAVGLGSATAPVWIPAVLGGGGLGLGGMVAATCASYAGAAFAGLAACAAGKKTR
jgi:hypothetical protein